MQDMAQGRGVHMLRSALELERRSAGHFFYEFVAVRSLHCGSCMQPYLQHRIAL